MARQMAPAMAWLYHPLSLVCKYTVLLLMLYWSLRFNGPGHAIKRGKDAKKGAAHINGIYTHLRGIKSVSAVTLSFAVLTDHQTAT